MVNNMKEHEPSLNIGTAHNSAAIVKVPIKLNRLKLLWSAICPWKRDIIIHAAVAGIFIAAPPQNNSDAS